MTTKEALAKWVFVFI